MTYQLHHGDCINIMPLIERESVDAIVTDPPYGLGFMGKDWDHGVPGMHFWLEALRCAKPGAHLLAFGGTRTFHRLAVAIEDAGWEIRDCVMWVYGQGFPKSHDVSKAIDREAGAEREVIGKSNRCVGPSQINSPYFGSAEDYENSNNITSPATPAAAEWDGWGTALKPAWEPIIVARKPLQGTVAENVQRYGTGALNIDGCRIETNGRPYIEIDPKESANGSVYAERREAGHGFDGGSKYSGMTTQGRWPANLIHDGSAEVLAGFPVTTNKGHFPVNGKIGSTGIYGSFNGTGNSEDRYTSDTGSAARFFYCAKASKQDRDDGLEGFIPVIRNDGRDESLASGDVPQNRSNNPDRNHHPTVKPTSLMRYLCRLVTPPQGVILDPFMGSGSTGKAAMLEGFNFIGIDTEIEYVEIAARRIEHACEKVGIVIEQPMMFETRRETVDKPKQMILL